jgi:hypothetical protein
MFLPGIGHFVGEFLISGDFSWSAYGEHKKQSAISSAITAVVFEGYVL